MRKCLILFSLFFLFVVTACDAPLVAYNVMRQQDQGKNKISGIMLDNVKQACEMYHKVYNQYPEKLDDLIHTPDNRSLLDAQTPPVDGWDRPIVFEKSATQIKLYSLGADGKANTDDDLVKTLKLEK